MTDPRAGLGRSGCEPENVSRRYRTPGAWPLQTTPPPQTPPPHPNPAAIPALTCCAWSAMSGAWPAIARSGRMTRCGALGIGSACTTASSPTPMRTSSDDADSPVGRPDKYFDLWCGVATSARPGFSSCSCWSRPASLDLLPGFLRLVPAHSRDGAPCSGRRPAPPRPSCRRIL
jgi:hypothetical protein